MLQRVNASRGHWPCTEQTSLNPTQMLASPCAVQRLHLSCFRVVSQPITAPRRPMLQAACCLRSALHP